MKTALLTGASGFVGKVLFEKLKDYYLLTTIGRDGSDIIQDISNSFKLKDSFDIIIHCAGKAHIVPKTQLEKEEFFKVNYQGTVNLVRALPVVPEAFVFISTVAVYGREDGSLISETEELQGVDPYAKSKIDAELFLTKWAGENDVRLTILRLPLVAGNNPPGNLGAMIKSIQKGYYFRIGDGSARRSMVWAEDVADFILHIVDAGGLYNLTDNEHPSFKEIDEKLGKALNKNIKAIHKGIIKVFAKVGDFIPGSPINSYRLLKMTSTLTFSNNKAKATGWKPKNALEELSKSLQK